MDWKILYKRKNNLQKKLGYQLMKSYFKDVRKVL